MRFSLLLLSMMLLSACGQKGPLFLPGNPSEVRSEVPTTNSPAQIEEEEEKDDDEQRR